MSNLQIRNQIQHKQIERSTVRNDFQSGILKTGSVAELAERYSLSEEEAKRLQADLVAEAKEALVLRFYLIGCNRLMKIVESDKARYSIPALKLLGSILGVLEKKPVVQMQINQQKVPYFEEMLRQVKQQQQQQAKTEILNAENPEKPEEDE